MVKTVWLRLGPTMCTFYKRLSRTPPPRGCRLIIAASRAGDAPGLRVAVRADVTQGLRMLVGGSPKGGIQAYESHMTFI